MTAGTVIGGRYRLTLMIGEGASASVWRAEDQTLERAVAIKLLFMGPQRDPQAIVHQFLREARLAASVQHRNVIHTVDFGVNAENVPYMVMELLDGETLAARMARTPALSMEEVVQVADLTLRGLAAVHDAGIVHRDLKPQNIFLQRESDAVYPKILDFGISRSLGSVAPSPIATQQGVILGTPDYMAPEQARGEGDIDRRADIYSMGTIIYEGIVGHVPFEANTIGELIAQIVTTTPPSMRSIRPDVPELLSDCVAQAMSPRREHRFADAAVFRRALQQAVDATFGAPSSMFVAESPVSLGAASAHTAAAWGELEGPSARSEGRVSPTREAAAAKPGPAPRPAHGQAMQVVHDDTLFGDDPLQAFAMASGALELDLSQAPLGASARFNPAAGVGGARRSHAGAAPLVRPMRRIRRPVAIWLLPVLLLMGFALLLLVPSLFSLPAPDADAAAEREASNPATRDSKRVFSQTPRSKLGGVSAPTRDVTF